MSNDGYPYAKHPTFGTCEVISTNPNKGTALIRYMNRMSPRRFRRSVKIADLVWEVES